MAESFREVFPAIHSTLLSVAEAVSRPPLMHMYHLTPFSLGAAVANGVSCDEVLHFLRRHSYGFETEAESIERFVRTCMQRYGLARVVTQGTRTMVQCKTRELAESLLGDAVLRSMALEPAEVQQEHFTWDDETRDYFFFCLRSRSMAKTAAARCVLLGLPIQQQYDYENDTSVHPVNISLRSQTKPRRYQVEAVEAASGDGFLRSGCLLLPCGAGKTLVGIMILCKAKRRTLIVCAGGVSVEQWRNQILEFVSLDAPVDSDSTASGKTRSASTRIACLTGKQKDPITEDTDVVLTTYSMLVSAHRMQFRKRSSAAPGAGAVQGDSSGKAKANPKEQLFSPFGLLILDEVHVIPAEAFRESLSLLDCKATIGLTATYVREDSKILDLYHLVGPKLYDVAMESLVADGYLARVTCAEVHTPMTAAFEQEYLERCVRTAGRAREVPAMVMLAAANPYKMLCVQELVRRHLAHGAKILVFCDHIALLQEYGKILSAPVVSGATQHKDRLMIFSDFQSTSKLNLICISRVGDVSVNLPSANVVIQVSSHGGSRRQEAQRLGRILRPKERSSGGGGVESYFYSIVSMDTLEMAYAAHRTTFLVDQGYTCRVMEYVPSPAQAAPKSEAEETAAPAPDTKRAKLEVGDAATIKREQLRDAVLLPVLRHTPGHRNASGTVDVADLGYQIRLLARVVSSWELTYQQGMRARRRGRAVAAAGVSEEEEEEEDGDEDSDSVASSAVTDSSGSDEDVSVVQPARGLREIKTEYGRARPVTGDDTAHHDRNALINQMVGADDGFVYHEL